MRRSTRWRSSTGVPGRMEHVAYAPERRAGHRRLRAHARRARDRARGAAPALPRPARRRVRLRRRPRSRQAAADGRDRASARRSSSSSPTTIRAARTPPRSAAPSSPPAPRRSEIGDRARRHPPRRSALLAPGDVLLIAGKGHETGQIVGTEVLPFDDADVARAASRGWRGAAMTRSGPPPKPTPRPAAAERRDWSAQRRVDRQPHAWRAAISSSRSRGPKFDGHDFVAAALAKGAAAAMVIARPQGVAGDAPLLRVADTQAALEALGRARAPAQRAPRSSRVTGSVGKTGTKEALRRALRAPGPHRRLGRQPQQSMGRAAVAGAHAARDRASACSRWA